MYNYASSSSVSPVLSEIWSPSDVASCEYFSNTFEYSVQFFKYFVAIPRCRANQHIFLIHNLMCAYKATVNKSINISFSRNLRRVKKVDEHIFFI